MKIRWKLLILLLAVAFAPLLFMRLTSQRAMQAMGEDLATRTHVALVDQAEYALGRLVDDHALVIKREIDLFEISLEKLVVDFERSLAQPSNLPPKVFYSGMGHNSKVLPGAVTSSRYTAGHSPKKTFPVSISYDLPAVGFLRGVRPAVVQEDIGAISDMLPSFSSLKDRLGDLLLWQYIVLDSGVYALYPAPSKAPMMFSPWKSDWYKGALKFNGLYWSAIGDDPVTHAPVLNLSIPVFDKSSSPIGVAGFTIPLAALLHQNPHHLAYSGVHTWLVRPELETGQEPMARIVATDQGASPHTHSWRLANEKKWLISKSTRHYRQFMNKIKNGESGVVSMEHNGKPSIWAHAPVLNDGTTLVITLPQAEVSAKAVVAERYVRERIDQQVTYTNFLLGLTLLAIFIAVSIISRRVNVDIKAMLGAVRKVADGNFKTRIPSPGKDELGELAHTFNTLVPALEDQIKMKEALEIASGVQSSLLPSEDIEINGLEFSGGSSYCDETGGDYYDLIEGFQRPGQVAVVVGDVTGHGVSAALLMASARAYLRARATQPGTLGEIISDVNRLIAADTFGTGKFITLFLLCVDFPNRKLSWVKAGHDPAIIYDPSTESFEELHGEGLPLGTLADSIYIEQNGRSLKCGQIVFIGTDGIWETFNAEGEMFGKERLMAVIKTNAGKPAHIIKQAVLDSVEAFRGTHSNNDDITLAVVTCAQATT